MQCWNCGFENVPGLTNCGRCASALSLASVAVEPPRASRWWGHSPLVRAVRWLATRRLNLTPLRRRLEALSPEQMNWRALKWSVIPGLGQIRTGRRRLGQAILIFWLLFWVLVAVSTGTGWQTVCYMLLVSVHAVAIMAVFASNLCWERVLIRLLFGLLVYFSLYYAVYQPLNWLFERFLVVVPIEGIAEAGLFADGDGLLVAGPWLTRTPHPGDIVLYRIHSMRGGDYLVRAGYGVDRILALPGDRVQFASGNLFVNGVAPAQGATPLASPVHVINIDRVVGLDEYAIYPSQLGLYLGHQNEFANLADRFTFVRQEDVIGRVLWRIRPLSRWGRIQ